MNSIFTNPTDKYEIPLSEVRFQNTPYKDLMGKDKILTDRDYNDIKYRWYDKNNENIFETSQENYERVINDYGITVNTFITAVYETLKNDIWFYFKEFCRIPMYGTTDLVPLKFNVGTVDFIKTYENGMSAILYNPRQTFSSVTMAALYTYINIFHPECAIELIDCNKDNKKMFMSKVKSIKSHIPKRFIALSKLNRQKIKTIKYILVNNFEFTECIQDILDLDGTLGDIRVLGNSVVNQRLLKKSPSLVWNLDHLPNIIDTLQFNSSALYVIKHPIERIMSPDRIEYMKRVLNNVPELMNQEIYRVRTRG